VPCLRGRPGQRLFSCAGEDRKLAGSRRQAIDRCLRALGEYHIGGIRNNIAFFREILDDPGFRGGDLHTGFIGEFLARRPVREAKPDVEAVAALVAAVDFSSGAAPPPAGNRGSRWRDEGRQSLLR
jgi:acetyl/propionyl-CoA carboxylase alpha subunit